MTEVNLTKKNIIDLLPHREPMLLIESSCFFTFFPTTDSFKILSVSIYTIFISLALRGLMINKIMDNIISKNFIIKKMFQY